MKIKNTLFALLGMLLTVSAFAQVPNAIRFQTTLRDANGTLIAEKEVGIRITIFSQQPKTDLYAETFTATTSPNGIATIVFGDGTVDSSSPSSFEEVWSEKDLWMRVEIDPNGGTNYSVISGESQLLSMPYAFRAKTAEKAEQLGNLRFAKVKVTYSGPQSNVPNIKLGGIEVVPDQEVEVLAYTPTYLTLSYPKGFALGKYRFYGIRVNGKSTKGQLTYTESYARDLKLQVVKNSEGDQYAMYKRGVNYYYNTKTNTLSDGNSDDDEDLTTIVNLGTNNTFELDSFDPQKPEQPVDIIVGPFSEDKVNVIELVYDIPIY